MQIAPPFGYQEIVPLLKTHKVRIPAQGEAPAFVRESNAVPVSFTEFQLAGRDYPIVFTGEGDKAAIAPVAVLGITAAENLFVRNAVWAPDTYVPAYVRRYPFCMARVQGADAAQGRRLICVEKSFVDEKAGEAMFDAAGKPAARWADLERLLSEYEADLERTREMSAILADYGLLERFTMQANLPKEKGGALHLTGMQRVSEKSLENLNAAQLKNLVRKGILARIYLHLLSLDNFSRLLERKARADRGAEKTA